MRYGSYEVRARGKEHHESYIHSHVAPELPFSLGNSLFILLFLILVLLFFLSSCIVSLPPAFGLLLVTTSLVIDEVGMA